MHCRRVGGNGIDLLADMSTGMRLFVMLFRDHTECLSFMTSGRLSDVAGATGRWRTAAVCPVLNVTLRMVSNTDSIA